MIILFVGAHDKLCRVKMFVMTMIKLKSPHTPLRALDDEIKVRARKLIQVSAAHI